ncbi:ABA4-like family protein [Hyphomonas sp.]|uniref:ABA4-like family protein n=1 Tax=Hyphomonas sp. TaxID=87 RepID=UPI0030F54430
MNYETLYTLINLSVLPAWLLLVVLPRAGITQTLVHSGLYPIALGVFYIVVMVMNLGFGMGAEGGSFSSAAGVSQLFSHPLGILVGWSHYLVFDLFVGAWQARDAQRRGVPHLALVPCLFFTLMLGPVGLLLYLIVRKLTGKGGWSLVEA